MQTRSIKFSINLIKQFKDKYIFIYIFNFFIMESWTNSSYQAGEWAGGEAAEAGLPCNVPTGCSELYDEGWITGYDNEYEFQHTC